MTTAAQESAGDIERTMDLVLRYGWNTTCYQIVNPGITRWFSSAGDAVIGYVSRAGVRVVAGAPVCALARLEDVIAEFEAESAEHGQGVCYFGAEDRIRAFAKQRDNYSSVVLGAQPVWTPAHWVERFDRDKLLRAQRARAMNKRVEVSEWSVAQATNHPELCRVLGEWLETRGLPPMHFLVEPQTLGMLQGRRVFVATIDVRPVGFTVLSPVPERSGWLTEQFVRGSGAPNGCVELLIDTAVSVLHRENARFITMGIVPLARCEQELEKGNPLWLRCTSSWARAHGRRFYNFGGLEWFKDKFHPDFWEPIYVISKEPQFSARTLYAVAAAFTGANPFAALSRGLFRAVRQEIRWFSSRHA